MTHQDFLLNKVTPQADQLMNCHVSQSIKDIFDPRPDEFLSASVTTETCRPKCLFFKLCRFVSEIQRMTKRLWTLAAQSIILCGPLQLWSQSHLESHGWSHSGEGRWKSDLYSLDIRLIFEPCQAWDICRFRRSTYFNQKIHRSTGRLSLMCLQQGLGNWKIILSFRWFHGRQYPRFLWDWLHPTQKGGRQC